MSRARERRLAAFVAVAVLLVSVLGSALLWRTLANAPQSVSLGQ